MRVKHQPSEFSTPRLVLVQGRVPKCRNRPPKRRWEILAWKVGFSIRKVWKASLAECLFDPWSPSDWEEGVSGVLSLSENLSERRGELVDNLIGVVCPLRLPLTQVELYHETSAIQDEVALVRCILKLMDYLYIVAILAANWDLVKHTKEEVLK